MRKPEGLRRGQQERSPFGHPSPRALSLLPHPPEPPVLQGLSSQGWMDMGEEGAELK